MVKITMRMGGTTIAISPLVPSGTRKGRLRPGSETRSRTAEMNMSTYDEMKRITSITIRFRKGPMMRTAFTTAMRTMAATGVPKRRLTREIERGKSPSAAIAKRGRAPTAM